LHRKVGLTQRHNLLAGVGILDQQITAVAAQVDIDDLAFPAFAVLNRPVRVQEVVADAFAAVRAGDLRAFDDTVEPLPGGVVEQGGEVTRRPVLLSFRAYLLDGLERGDVRSWSALGLL